MIKEITRLSKGTWIYGVGRILNTLVGLLLLPVFTAYLTPKDYGIISTLIFIAFLATPIFKLGFDVSSGLLYFEGNNNVRKNETIWTAFIILLVSATLLTILVFIFSKKISYSVFQVETYKDYIKLYILTTAFAMVMVPLQQCLQFEERAKTFVILTLSTSLVTICLNILFVVVWLQGIQGWLLGTLIGQFCSLIAFLIAIISSTKFKINFLAGKLLLKHGYPMIPGFAFLFIIEYSGRYALLRYRGLEEVGIYTIGYSMGKIMSVAVDAFKSAWYPFFQSFINKKAEAKQIFGRISSYYVLGFGALSLLFFAFAKPVTVIMTEPVFHKAYSIIGIIALAHFFSGLFTLFLPGVYYAKKVYLVSLVQFVSSIIVIILNLILIPAFGFIGAAFTIMLGFMAMVFLQQTVNIAGKFWIPSYEEMRLRKFSLLSIFIISCVIFSNIRFSIQGYLFILPLFLIMIGLSAWSILLKQEKTLIQDRILKLRT